MRKLKNRVNLRQLAGVFFLRSIALALLTAAAATIWQSYSAYEAVFSSAVQSISRMGLLIQGTSSGFRAIADAPLQNQQLEPLLHKLDTDCRLIETLHGHMIKGDPALSLLYAYQPELQNIYYHKKHQSGLQIRSFLEKHRQLAVMIEDSSIVDRRGFAQTEAVVIPRLLGALSLAGGQLETAREYRRLTSAAMLVAAVLLIWISLYVLEKRHIGEIFIKKLPKMATSGISQIIEHFDPQLGSANKGLFAQNQIDRLYDEADHPVFEAQFSPAGRDVVTIRLDDAVEIRINVRKFCASLSDDQQNEAHHTRKMKLARLLEKTLQAEGPQLPEYRMIIRRLGDLLLRDSRAVRPGRKLHTETTS